MPDLKEKNYALTAESVSKIYSHGIIRKSFVPALRDISLKIPQGGIFGLLGPNGAGKTTLVNVFNGLLKADQGEIYILGQKLSALKPKELRELKTRMNMCSGAPNFPWSFTVKEILVFYGMLYGIHAKLRNKRVFACIELLELEKYRDTMYDSLSSGTKQRVALAKSLLNEPDILFLDEPTLGLDPDMAIKIRTLIASINKQRNNTIVLTTHYMKEAEALCGKIAFIKGGRIVAEGTSAELEKMTKSHDLEEVFLELTH